jgi:hypothetical protein
MSMNCHIFDLWLRPVSTVTLALVSLAIVSPTQAASAPPPIPQGAVRIWFYRTFEPSVSLGLADVKLNGVRIGSVPDDGPALYRDVPPGNYRITVENSVASNQSKDVNLAPGREVIAKIVAIDSSIGDGPPAHRPTYDLSFVTPETARKDMQGPR